MMMMQYYASAISHDRDMSFEKFGGLLVTHILFCEKIYSQPRDKLIFKSMDPMSLAKCPTPFDVKFHRGECVKDNYNRMESIPIGE